MSWEGGRREIRVVVEKNNRENLKVCYRFHRRCLFSDQMIFTVRLHWRCGVDTWPVILPFEGLCRFLRVYQLVLRPRNKTRYRRRCLPAFCPHKRANLFIYLCIFSRLHIASGKEKDVTSTELCTYKFIASLRGIKNSWGCWCHSHFLARHRSAIRGGVVSAAPHTLRNDFNLEYRLAFCIHSNWRILSFFVTVD